MDVNNDIENLGTLRLPHSFTIGVGFGVQALYMIDGGVLREDRNDGPDLHPPLRLGGSPQGEVRLLLQLSDRLELVSSGPHAQQSSRAGFLGVDSA